MSFRKVKTGLVAAALAGLCALAQANTTVAMPALPLLAQNDISLMPGGRTDTGPVETEAVPMPDVSLQPQDQTALAGPVRIGLLLPLRSDSLGAAAAMVRDGFIAAHEKRRDPNITLTVVETGDAAQDVLDAYNGVLADQDIMVGPLSRSGAAAIASRGAGFALACIRSAMSSG